MDDANRVVVDRVFTTDRDIKKTIDFLRQEEANGVLRIHQYSKCFDNKIDNLNMVQFSNAMDQENFNYFVLFDLDGLLDNASRRYIVVRQIDHQVDVIMIEVRCFWKKNLMQKILAMLKQEPPFWKQSPHRGYYVEQVKLKFQVLDVD